MLKRVFVWMVAIVAICSLPVMNAYAQDGGEDEGGEDEMTEVRQWASGASATSEFGTDSWSAAQSTGEPDTEECGDLPTAWASADPEGQDVLTLTYDSAVVPTEVNIYQTYNPGAITEVALLPADGGDPIAVPDSADPGTECPGVFSLAIEMDDLPPVNGVVITLDQTLTESWNEIDAVELVGMGEAPETTEEPADTDSGLALEPGDDVELYAAHAAATSEYGVIDWSARQAMGEPDGEECGDQTNAWASFEGGQDETLTTYFEEVVFAEQFDIYEVYNVGGITGIELILASGQRVAVSDSASTTTDCPNVHTVDVDGSEPVAGIAINLDQSESGSWSEIDAVKVSGAGTGQAVVAQWASNATATTEFEADNWGAIQATGEPTVLGCVDSVEAWASLEANTLDVLTVTYDEAVLPLQVAIYQTNATGAITDIHVLPADGSDPILVESDAITIERCPSVHIVTIPGVDVPVNGVEITVDQTLTGEWNEIDAVQLIGLAVE